MMKLLKRLPVISQIAGGIAIATGLLGLVGLVGLEYDTSLEVLAAGLATAGLPAFINFAARRKLAVKETKPQGPQP